MLGWAAALAVASLAAAVLVRNRVVRRRLRFTVVTLLALAALHLATQQAPPLIPVSPETEGTLERLLFAFALINAAVALLFNPWFQDRVSDRSPAIVQDAVVLAIFGGTAVFLLKDATFLTASAIAAAAVGFALQDTLSNAIAGLAIQIEKPFRVGHWVSVANYEGAVAEITWRATKIRTKAGNLVVIPNNVIGKEAINNYSEPALPTRAVVEVGAAYGVPPNEARDAILAAMRQVARVLPAPQPEALLQDFGASALTYRARFWIADFSHLEYAQDEVRRAIYYEFRRRNIEIPWPIQIEYHREDSPQDTPARREGFLQTIAGTPVLAGLGADAHRALAAGAEERIYGDGEVIVREGDPGASMFLVRHGRVVVTTALNRGEDSESASAGAAARGGGAPRALKKEEQREVAVTEAGGYFGEMSLLTGEPRTATVTARGDCRVLEIDAAAFGIYIRSHPEAIDSLASAAEARRRGLDASRVDRPSAPVEAGTLAQRIRKFLGLSPAAPR